MKNKKIFISGGAGVIGSELVKKLYRSDALLMVGDLKPMPKDWPQDIKYRQGDLNFMSKSEIETFEPEIFIHLAATFERSVENYEFFEDNFIHNTSLSNHLITLIKDCKSLARVIFASSYLIYDPKLYTSYSPSQTPYKIKESDPVYPRNLTGVAKFHHEIELRFLKGFKTNQFTSVTPRIYRGYGKGSKCIISRWIRDLLANKTIEVYQKEGKFDYIYSEEIANGLFKLIQHPEIEGVINLGNENARSVEEVLNILKKHFPAMKYIEKLIDAPYEASQADMSLFKSKTGWKPTIQIEDAIPKIIQYERKKTLPQRPINSNILITSISKKISLIQRAIQAAKETSPSIKVFGGDLDQDCIGAFFVDSFWKMKPINAIETTELISYCQRNNINSIIPTRDGELLYFSKHKELLKKNGINVMVSDQSAIQHCSDKLDFFKIAQEHGIPAIQTTENVNAIEAKSFAVKERFGAGSRKIGLNLSKEAALEHSRTMDKPIFQPYIPGDETTVDIYVNKKRKIKGMIMRRRDVVVNGESQITTTYFDKRLEMLCKDFADRFNFYGHILLQIITDTNSNFHIVECNPRFGGASNLSCAAGLNSFYWFILESNGIDIDDYPFLNSPDKHIRQITYPANKIITVK